MSSTTRRWNAWGFEGVALEVAPAARAWLAAHLGRGEPLPSVSEAEVRLTAARPVAGLPLAANSDAATRLRHACGQSYPDVIALRTGAIAAFPDAVAFPESAEQVSDLLRAARAGRFDVVVRGGGTSVVGGVTVAARERPTVVLSLERLSGLVALDEVSGLATLRAGTLGPDVEALLAPRGFRLGHEPQSFELSTVGGWVATRSAGQRSTGVGKIEDLVAGLEVVTADGVWNLPAQPSSAAGPELRRLMIGSEGRLGVITAATLRVRSLPPRETGRVVLLPGWEQGLEVCRRLVRSDAPLEVMRLSDPQESSFAATLLHLPPLLGALFRRVLRTRRFGRGCMLLLGWAGERTEVRRARATARRVWRMHGGLGLGARGFTSWRRDRFRHPYLRDALLSAGWGIDTLETAAPWSELPVLRERVREAITAAAWDDRFRVAVLCHLSHAYRDGASLYFTFLWPLAAGRELERWSALKQAATGALLAAGGTLTHHHGVGTMHAPYLAREIGARGVELLRAAAATADPAGTLNPGVLLAETAGGLPSPEPRAPSPGGREGGD